MTNTGGWQFSGPAEADRAQARRALRILICDDDEDAASTLAAILHDEGHSVRTVYGGRQVLAAVINFNPEVVILDLHMPDVSGWQVAATLRARVARPPLLIAITGYYTKSADRILSQVTGFDHYMVKPVEPAELLKAIKPLQSAAP